MFEVEDLSQASPATVSRAGMIFLTLEDLGWWPYAESWIERRTANGTHAVCFSIVSVTPSESLGSDDSLSLPLPYGHDG